MKGCQGSLGTLGNYCNIHREEKKIYINKTKQNKKKDENRNSKQEHIKLDKA